MGFRFLRDNKEIDTVARAIADDLYSNVLPDVATARLSGKSDLSKKKASRVDQKMTDVVLQIKRFSEAKGLGIYGKARLQQKFNERLEELGYKDSTVRKLSELILLRNT